VGKSPIIREASYSLTNILLDTCYISSETAPLSSDRRADNTDDKLDCEDGDYGTTRYRCRGRRLDKDIRPAGAEAGTRQASAKSAAYVSGACNFYELSC